MPRSHQTLNSSLKWSWWILNEEFPVLLGIHFCQSELPAGVAVTPGSGYSGAFLGMSAECCPCPAAVVTAPPLKQSLYLPVPPFFVFVLPPLLCRALQSPPGAAGPTPSQGSSPPVEPSPTALPLQDPTAFPSHSIPISHSHSTAVQQSHSIPAPQSHGPTAKPGLLCPCGAQPHGIPAPQSHGIPALQSHSVPTPFI